MEFRVAPFGCAGRNRIFGSLTRVGAGGLDGGLDLQAARVGRRVAGREEVEGLLGGAAVERTDQEMGEHQGRGASHPREAGHEDAHPGLLAVAQEGDAEAKVERGESLVVGGDKKASKGQASARATTPRPART